MRRIGRFLRGKKGTLLLGAAAGILLLSSAIGSTKAALTYFSENYTAQVEMKDIGVTLRFGKSVLLVSLIPPEKVAVGKPACPQLFRPLDGLCRQDENGAPYPSTERHLCTGWRQRS